MDSTTCRHRNICSYHVLNTHARSHRRIDRNVSTRARASLNWSRATLNRNCRRDLFLQIGERLRAFTLLTPLRLQPGYRLGLGSSTSCISSFWPLLPSARSRKRARSAVSGLQRPIHASQTQIRQVLLPALLHLVVPEVRDRPHVLSSNRCPVRFNLRIHVSSTFVSWQTFVTFRIMLHLFANPISTLFRAGFDVFP